MGEGGRSAMDDDSQKATVCLRKRTLVVILLPCHRSLRLLVFTHIVSFLVAEAP